MSGIEAALVTMFAPAAAGGAAATATGGFLAGVVGTAVKGAFVGGLVSGITGGDVGKGIMMGGLGGAALGGLGGLGTFGGGAGAGAGAGAASGAASGAGGGLFGNGFLGQMISGGAQAWMGAKQREQEEEYIRDEEERRENRYSGSGAALSPFRNDGNSPVGLDGGFAQKAASGRTAVDERAVDRGVLSAGDEYQRKLGREGNERSRRRARYNPQTGRIEYEGGR